MFMWYRALVHSIFCPELASSPGICLEESGAVFQEPVKWVTCYHPPPLWVTWWDKLSQDIPNVLHQS